MESHILSASAAYSCTYINLEERPKIEKTRDNLLFDLERNK